MHTALKIVATGMIAGLTIRSLVADFDPASPGHSKGWGVILWALSGMGAIVCVWRS